MARTRSALYPQHQTDILNTAARLFADKGFARTSIAELAAACDSSKALLYHYYDSKQALLATLLRTHLQELQRVTQEALASSDEPEGQFRALVGASMTIYTQARDKHRVLMNDLGCLPPVERETIRDIERELTATVADLLCRLNPALQHDPRLRMPYTMMFYGLLNWTYVWYDDAGPMSPDEFAERAAALFLYGFQSLACPS